jgi:hypothetical protein
MIRGPGRASGESGPFGWRRDQRLDELVADTGNPVARHVATDHPIGQTRLKRLVDDAPAPAEIRFAARDEVLQRQFFGSAAKLYMKHTDSPGFAGQNFDFPHALATIASVLLDDARAK